MVRQQGVVAVVGETLIDLIPVDGDLYQAVPGGSPANVAVGLARFGVPTRMAARISADPPGRILRRRLAEAGVDLRGVVAAAEPSSLALVTHEADGPRYDLRLHGTADWQWTEAETALVPPDTAVLHFGSVASWTPPAEQHIHRAVKRVRAAGTALISYDPNIRPALLGDPARGRPAVERGVALAHLVKASREDVEWLYPDTPLERIAAHWLDLGALLVVVTDGPDGAHVFRSGASSVSRPGRTVAVVDTVGAGDAFTSGLLGALLRHGLHTPRTLAAAAPDVLATAVDDAILVSALTCERLGADPPTALPRPHLPARAPLTVTDLAFADGAGRMGAGSPAH